MELLFNIITIQWNAFKDINIYGNLSIKEILLGVFVVGCIAVFINMFTHRGE